MGENLLNQMGGVLKTKHFYDLGGIEKDKRYPKKVGD